MLPGESTSFTAGALLGSRVRAAGCFPCFCSGLVVGMLARCESVTCGTLVSDLLFSVSHPLQGIADTAQTIYETAAREHESRGVTGAVGEVLRQIPPAVVKPLIVATEATSNVLGGMRNQIRPDVRQDESQKWRHGED